ncbi:uncharacterized protein LOC142346219 [Convolutriloba macropyga]|uniref:uncharacterized protein LOC142346219 n=1 Tax=Convolutriloba macropyga TaxID=536237 RepID=UPI003F51D8DC
MQFEKGKGGTRHLQAVLRFKNQVHFNTAKSIFQPEQPHVEVCASPLSSLANCSKEEGREEGPVSTLSKDDVGQGKRSDLGEVAQAVRSGQSLKRVAEQFTIQFIKYHRGIGKSRLASDLATVHYPEDEPFTKTESTKWWDGYHN